MSTLEPDTLKESSHAAPARGSRTPEQGLTLEYQAWDQGVRMRLQGELKWNGLDDVVFLRALALLLDLGVDWIVAIQELIYVEVT